MEKSRLFLQRFKQELSHLFKIRNNYQKELFQNQLVSIITPTKKPSYLVNIFSNYRKQTYQNKELIIILNNNTLNYEKWVSYSQQFSNVRIYQLDETATLGECLNYGISQSQGAYVAKFDDDDYYGPNYLRDAGAHFLVSQAAIICKAVYFVFFERLQQVYYDNRSAAFAYVSWGAGGTQVIKKEVFAGIGYPQVDCGEDQLFLSECYQKGLKLYSGDPFNYGYLRHVNEQDQTWQIKDQSYVNQLNFLADTPNYKAFIRV